MSLTKTPTIYLLQDLLAPKYFTTAMHTVMYTEYPYTCAIYETHLGGTRQEWEWKMIILGV